MTKSEKIEALLAEFRRGGWLARQEWDDAKRELIWQIWLVVSEDMGRTEAYYEVARQSKSVYSTVVEVVREREAEASKLAEQ